MLILVILNVIVFGVFHALSIQIADYHYFGLLSVILLNSIYASRKFKYGKAVLFPIIAITLFIILKYIVNYLGNYRVIVDSGTELPIGYQIFSSVIELIAGIILGSILILLSQLIKKPQISVAEKEDLINSIGSDE